MLMSFDGTLQGIEKSKVILVYSQTDSHSVQACLQLRFNLEIKSEKIVGT